ncbi:MAG: hypothetical protein KDJ65_19765 [Anaerolineae bacterium]|nr:hypothetical protein [Anaerolineae bacterium]
MTGSFFLDWATLAVSLVNVILQFWLGATVLLNAERRTWGVWLTGGGMLMGTAFFVIHSTILGYGLSVFSSTLNFWWRVGWIPVIALPFVWYVIMLWYTGYWDDRTARWPRQQRGRLALAFGGLVGLIGWLALASPLPSFTEVVMFRFSAAAQINGLSLFLVSYPLYIILCLGLALQALRHPLASERLMGDEGRRRAKPWLVATTIVMLLVSLLVASVIGWVLLNVTRGSIILDLKMMGVIIAGFDLVISSLIAIAVVLLGQAVVSYEIFTGKTLPRGEFQRQWFNAIVLAVGYGAVVSWSLTLQMRAIYTLLLTTLLMTLFFALLNWRSYTWRDRYIRRLRPFVTSQRLYEHLLAPSTAPPDEVDSTTPFKALCEDILGVQQAMLTPFGPLAPLVQPLAYPTTRPLPALPPEMLSNLQPEKICLRLDPHHNDGLLWAVPLWSERGLIGIFWLGQKWDGGLYTQEEIEIARAGGERLIDTQASAEIARRLMSLQRQRLAESQILDRRTRRVLHDDILPQLHTALLSLSAMPGVNGANAEAIDTLTQAHHQISDLLREMPKSPAPTLDRLGFVAALHRVVADEFPNAFDAVTWQIEPTAEAHLRSLSTLTGEVLFYAAREAIRNAARHARDPASTTPLMLEISVAIQDALLICIKDNGRGIQSPKPMGSGQGLALHSTMLAIIGGELNVESVADQFTRVRITLPQSPNLQSPISNL